MMRRFVPEAEAPDRGLYNPRDAEKQARIMRRFDTSVSWATRLALPVENHRTILALEDLIGYMWYKGFRDRRIVTRTFFRYAISLQGFATTFAPG